MIGFIQGCLVWIATLYKEIGHGGKIICHLQDMDKI